MNPSTILHYAWSSVRGRPGRSLGLVAGICLCVALYVALTALAEGYDRLVRQPWEQLDADVTIQRPGPPLSGGGSGRIMLPPSNLSLTAGEVDRIAALPGMVATSPALLLWDRSDRTGFTVVLGIDLAPRTGSPRLGPAVVQDWIVAGRPLAGDDDLVLEKHFARFHRLKLGDLLEIQGRETRITGIMEVKQGSILTTANVFVSLARARNLAGLPPGSANLLYARLGKGIEVDALRTTLAAGLPGAIVTASDSIGEMGRGMGMISGHFTLLASLLALTFAIMASHRLLSGAVHERRAEFGIMKAVGWLRRDVATVLAFEATMLGLLGGLAGVILGYLVAALLGQFTPAPQLPWNLTPVPAGVRPSGVEASLAPHLSVVLAWPTIVIALVVSAVLTGITGWLISRALSRESVMEALRQP